MLRFDRFKQPVKAIAEGYNYLKWFRVIWTVKLKLLIIAGGFHHAERMIHMRKTLLIAVLTMCMTVLMAGVAFAAHTDKGDRTGYDARFAAGSCDGCHAKSPKHREGPHGGYSASTTKCAACHTVHNAGNARLLPGTTVTSACNYCHDLTGTPEGPYSAEKITNPSDVKAAHRVAGVTYFSGIGAWDSAGSGSIPGGDATTGGAAYLNTAGQGKLSGTSFTCDSCHTPHAVVGTTVAKYLGESRVKETGTNPENAVKISTDLGRYIFMTDRILKKNVNGKTVNNYGTAWCAACHDGRDNDMGGATNHPVNKAADAYTFLDDEAFVTGDKSSVTTKGFVYVDPTGTFADRNFTNDPRTNKRLAMVAGDPLNGNAVRPDGNVAYATGTGPSCQQCHGSARDVETSFWTGTFNTSNLDGQMTFPHISTNKGLLVESGDDFCTNCHGLNLP